MYHNSFCILKLSLNPRAVPSSSFTLLQIHIQNRQGYSCLQHMTRSICTPTMFTAKHSKRVNKRHIHWVVLKTEIQILFLSLLPIY